MQITVKHICGCEKIIEVKGPREAQQYRKWLASTKCADCQKK